MPVPVHHRRASVGGIAIFYREAGPVEAPELASAVTVNVCKRPVDCFDTGLTANTPSMVKISPARRILDCDAVHPSVFSVCVQVSFDSA